MEEERRDVTPAEAPVEDIEETMSDGASGEEKERKKKKKVRVRTILAVELGLVIIALLGALAYAYWLGNDIMKSDTPVGRWEVLDVTSGDTVMTREDAENLGMTGIGYIKFMKSGKCEMKFLDFKANGKWEQDEEGVVSITYKNNESLPDHGITARIDEDGIMTIKDETLITYRLEKGHVKTS